MRALNDYALRKSLPGALKGALKQHLVLEMAVDKVRPDVLNAFPHHLKAKVLRSQYKDLVARTALFHGTSPQFLDQVVRARLQTNGHFKDILTSGHRVLKARCEQDKHTQPGLFNASEKGDRILNSSRVCKRCIAF